MPGVNGIEATRQLTQHYPGVAIVVLITYSDDTSVLAAFKASARSYLTKDADRVEIAHALRSSANGLAVLDRALQANLVDAAWRSEPPDQPTMTLPERLPAGLTKRKAEILAMMACGLANSQIAAALYLSPHTVKSHINHISPRPAPPIVRPSCNTPEGMVLLIGIRAEGARPTTFHISRSAAVRTGLTRRMVPSV